MQYIYGYTYTYTSLLILKSISASVLLYFITLYVAMQAHMYTYRHTYFIIFDKFCLWLCLYTCGFSPSWKWNIQAPIVIVCNKWTYRTKRLCFWKFAFTKRQTVPLNKKHHPLRFKTVVTSQESVRSAVASHLVSVSDVHQGTKLSKKERSETEAKEDRWLVIQAVTFLGWWKSDPFQGVVGDPPS